MCKTLKNRFWSNFNVCAIIDVNEYIFQIKSTYYNLLEEKGIICYYNLNDMYHDYLLNDIMNLKTPN